MTAKYAEGEEVYNRYTGERATIESVTANDAGDTIYSVTYHNDPHATYTARERSLRNADRNYEVIGMAKLALDSIEDLRERLDDLTAVGALDEYSARTIHTSFDYAVKEIRTKASANRYEREGA